MAWNGNKSVRLLRQPSASSTSSSRIHQLQHDTVSTRSNQLIPTTTAIPSAILCGLLLFQPSVAVAAPYTSDAVSTAIQTLQDAKGDAAATVKAYEAIAEIITEGKGVGGAVNFQGVQLERGYIADEDTTLYNPGLSLLTETEKTELVKSIVESKRNTLSSSNVDTQAGYDFLREKLDPLHMYELEGYLKVVPFYGAAVYLAVLAVQQFARELFPVAYLVGALAVFGPAIVLVLLGPQ